MQIKTICGIIGSLGGESLEGKAAIQAASEPNQLSICVNKANYTHDMIQRTGKFTVSVLSQKAQFELFKHFGFQSGRDTNKFKAFEQCARGTNGIYYIT